MNGSHAPELTDLLKEITENIAKYIIKEGLHISDERNPRFA